MWSGDVVNAQYYLPKGVKPEVLAYWFPPDGKGHGRQRPDGDPDARARTRCSRTCSSTSCSTRRTRSTTSATSATSRRRTSLDAGAVGLGRLRPGQPRDRGGQAGVVRRGLPAARAAAGRPTRRGTRSGSSSRPAPDDAGRRAGDARTRPRQPALAGAARCRAPCGWLLLFLVPLYVVLAIVFGRLDPIFRTPLPGLEPARVEHRAVHSTCSRTSSARTATSARPCCAPRSTSLLASVLCLLIAYPVAYYTARLRRPAPQAAARAADRAVLDQLHDADAGLGQPAAERRPGQPVAQPRRAVRRRTSTGSTGGPSSSCSAWSTATCRT